MPEKQANEVVTTTPPSLRGQFGKFVLSGGASAGTDLGLYALFIMLGVHPLAANPITRSAGGLVSFLLNRHWTFAHRHSKDIHIHFMKFWITWGVAFFLSEGLIWLFHSRCAIGPMLTKIFAEGLTGLLVFLTHRHWTFK